MLSKMSRTFVVAWIVITTSLMKTETLEIKEKKSDFNNTLFYRDSKYTIFPWTPRKFVTAVLLLAAMTLTIKLICKENLSIHKRSRNIGVIRGSVLLPWRIPIIDEMYSLIYLRVGGVKVMEKFTRKYGRSFEIQCGPVYLTLISDPEVIQKVLSSSQREHLNKPTIYRKVFYDGFQDGLLTSEFGPWSAQRKRLSRSFTYKSLQQYLKFINIHAKNLTKSIISAGSEKQNVQGKLLQTFIYRHTFRIITQILFDVDRFDDDENAEFSDNFCKYKDHIVDRIMNPLSLGHYLWFHPKKKEYNRIKNFLEEFKIKNLQRCREEMEKEKTNEAADKEESKVSDYDINIKPFRCMIKQLICSGASDKEIGDQIVTIAATSLYFAIYRGHETSVVAMTMLLMNLANNPEAQAKCRDEVDKLFNNKILYKGENSLDCEFNMEDISNLKYLDRCILESGRLHSTVPFFLRRLDAPVEINDEVVLGAGTNLGILLWTLHRDPKFFPDPEKFDPDRFLCENVKKRHPYAYIPFSSGPRNCIGSKVAHLQIKVFMAWIIRNFEILSTDKIEDVKLHLGLTIVPERPFNIILRRCARN